MEKIENIKKDNRLTGVLSNKIVKYAVGTFLLSALGVALPRGFHLLAGSSAGATFLPMHICILIAALTFGIVSSTLVAGSSVVFSFLLTGMPSLARLPYMLIELVIYAVVLSVLNKKYNSYVSLIATMILGRILYAGVLFASVNILGFSSYGISVMESVKLGIPGIILQLLFVPIIAKLAKKGLNLKNG
ncbi:MAG: ECF transporter S component [Clostridia bacterium]|jgi:hypothetical protein|nr:ECF transporter S component [Clostridia bacterium]